MRTGLSTTIIDSIRALLYYAIPEFLILALFINERRRGGRIGGGAQGSVASAKDGLLLFVFFAVMIVVVLVLSGPTTGSSGIFGNVTVARNARESAVTLSQFFSVVGLLIIITIIGKLT